MTHGASEKSGAGTPFRLTGGVQGRGKSRPVTGLRLVLLGVGVAAIFSGCATVKPYSGEPVNVGVEHVLNAIDEAARTSYQRFKDSSIEFTEISVTLETVLEKETSGEAEFAVVTVEGSREKSFTQSVTVSLKAPKKASTGETSQKSTTSPHPNLVNGLVKGIDAALLAASGAREGLQAIHPQGVPFEASTITAEISFAVTGTLSGTPEIKVFGIELFPSHSRTRENVHSIKMVFTIKSEDKARAATS